MLVEAMTMAAFQEAARDALGAILPVGATEEHGPHLPLGTDTIHAYELARLAGEREPVLVMPPIWYGLCRSTSQHPGTVTVRGATLRLLVQDVITSLYGHGLRSFVVLSGHAGTTHMASLVDGCEELLSSLPEARLAVVSVLDLVSVPGPHVETSGDSHAGEIETSLMLHLRPMWVHGTAPEEYPTFPRHIIVRDKRACWPGGVWGDPAKASAEKGREIMEEEVERLLDLLHRLNGAERSQGAQGQSEKRDEESSP